MCSNGAIPPLPSLSGNGCDDRAIRYRELGCRFVRALFERTDLRALKRVGIRTPLGIDAADHRQAVLYRIETGDMGGDHHLSPSPSAQPSR